MTCGVMTRGFCMLLVAIVILFTLSGVSLVRAEVYDLTKLKLQMQGLDTKASSFGSSCSTILSNDLIYDQYQKLSSRFRVDQYYNWACKSDFNSAGEMRDAGAKLGIPIDGLPAPLGLEGVFKSSDFRQSLNQWCSVAWSNLSDQATYEEFSRVVNQGMVSAYKTCIENERETLLKKFGVFAYVTPQDDFLRKFIVSLEFRPPTFDYKPRITGIEGSDIKCTLNGAPIQFPLRISNPSLTLTCIKSVDDSRVISFNTEPTGSSAPARLPGMNDGVLLDITQRTKGLAQSIRKIETAPTVFVYQCPNGTQGWNPGGAWGSYGCTGQITTNSTCSNIEYPHVQVLSCTPLGNLRRF